MAPPCVARRRGRAGAPSSRARRAARRPSRSRAISASCCSTTADCTTAWPMHARISDGCSTSKTQSVNACSMPVARGGGDDAGASRRRLVAGRRSAGLAQQPRAARQVSASALVGGLAGQRHLEQQARLEQLLERHGAGLEHHRDRVAEAAADALRRRCAATKMPPPGPLLARIRLPLASSLSASRSVGRLTPNSARQVLLAAEEVARPEPLALDVVLDLDRDLLAGAADRAARRGDAPGALARSRPPSAERSVDHPPRLAVGARQHAGRDRHDAHAQAELLAHRLLERRARPRRRASSTSSLISSMPLGSE